jgi:ParB/RepB/Spo0J family partition protein
MHTPYITDAAQEVEQLPAPASRDTLKKFAKAGRQTYFIRFNKIHIRPGFNTRVEEDFAPEDIAELAEMIKANGIVVPLVVDITEDGVAWLEQGYRRHAALQLLKEQGWLVRSVRPGINKGTVECFVNNRDKTELHRVKGIIVSNSVKPLSFKSKCAVALRLKSLDEKASNEAIAKELGCSRQSVDNMLILASQPDYVNHAIDQEVFKPTTAVTLVRKFKGDEKGLRAFVANAVAAGQEIRVKDIQEAFKEKTEKAKASVEKGIGKSEFATTSVQQTWTNPQEEAVTDNVEEDDLTDAELDEAVDNFNIAVNGNGNGIETTIHEPKGYKLVPSSDKAELEQANKSTKPRDHVAEKKIQEIKDEEAWCTDIIKNLDSILIITTKGLKPKPAADVERLIHFSQQKIQSIKEFVHKAEIRS